MSTRPGMPFLAAVLAELADADEAVKRDLAAHLRPYLGGDPDRLLDADEMASLLQIHPDTLVKMARAGRVWAEKVGREWRFRADRADVLPVAGTLAPPRPTGPARSRRPDRSDSAAAIRGRS